MWTDREHKPIVCDAISMPLCKDGQIGVCGIAFMGDMRSPDAGAGTQETLRAHAICVLNNLLSVEMAAARLFWTIGVI
jgi:hypothetical protein